MKNITGVIVGLGSVGRLHASALSQIASKIIVVDPHNQNKDWAINNLGIELIFLNEIDQVVNHINTKEEVTLGVVSNWGPNHFKTLKKLIKFKVSYILCEKPLVNSIYRANRIKRLIKKNKVRFLYGITRRYTGFTQVIKTIFKTHCGDEILFISFTGGAQCLITTGIHWFDFACEILDEIPDKVFASLTDDAINPRNSELGYWEGSSIWMFKNSRSISMQFSNKSYAKGSLVIYGKFGFLEINPNGQVEIYTVSSISVPQEPKITNTKNYEHKKTLKLNELNLEDPFATQIKLLLSDEQINYKIDQVVTVFNCFIGSLISSKRGKVTNIPISKYNLRYYKKFPVS